MLLNIRPVPAPTLNNLTATPSLRAVVLLWDMPTDTTYAGAEIWSNSTNSVASATKIGTVTTNTFTDSSTSVNPVTNRYYWVRAINIYGRTDGTWSNSAVAKSLLATNLDIAAGAVQASNLNVAAIDPVTGNLASGVVSTASFASGIQPVSIVSALPAVSGYTGPKVVMLSTDSKLYRYTGSAWTSATPAIDITGTLTSSQIASVDSSKLVGALTSAQIASIDVTKLVGQITSTQITDNSITTAKIGAGAVTAAKILAGTITGNEIAANTITAGQIAANTITAAQIAADTITAGQIAAGAIGATELAAGAVTAGKIAVGDFENLVRNPNGTLNAEGWFSVTYGSVASVTDTSAPAIEVAGGSRDMYLDNWFPVVPGDEFWISFDGKWMSGDTSQANVGLSYSTGYPTIAGQTWNGPATVAGGTSTWLTGSAKSVAPAGAAYARVWIQHPVTNGVLSTWRYRNLKVMRRNKGELIVDGAITATQIAARTITAGQIAAGAITANEIAANTITAAQIWSGYVYTGTLNANQITVGKLTASQIDTQSIVVDDTVSGAINAVADVTLVATGVGAVAGNLASKPAATAPSITNGTFASNLNGWTTTGSVAWSSGIAQLTPNGSNGTASVSQSIATVPGRTYSVTFDILTGPVIVVVGTANGVNDLYNPTSALTQPGTGRNFTFTATTTTSYLMFLRAAAGTYGVDNVSIAEAWDAGAYSRDSFTGGAYASASPQDATHSLMFGLNSAGDLTDTSYTTLDYAIYLRSDGAILVYESGAQVGGTYGSYVGGDVFAVAYDGSGVDYLKNGVVFYTSVSAASKVAGQVLFFDSSFATSGGKLNGVRFGPLTSNNWANIGGTGKPEDGATVGAPAGTFVAGVAASTVATATTNFNASNDRNSTAIAAPTILADGTAVDHTIRTDGSADISFEWAWSGNEGDIDGFLVYVYQASTNAAYTFGTTPAAETVFTLPAAKRAFIMYGVGATLFTKFGVRAYRSVDKDVNAAGVIMSTIAVPSLAAENPYQPSTSVAFTGNITGTINGIPVANVNVWSAITGTGKPVDNATADIALVATGSVTVSGNTATKGTGTGSGWDGQVYSRDSFTGGAYASIVAADITSTISFGLNSSGDLTGVDFTGIDWSLCLDATTNPISIKVIESGTQIGGSRGTWAANDVFAVVYDGSSVKYLKNGVVFYTSLDAASTTANQVLFFDSSFFSVGAVMKSIRFGPLSSNWNGVQAYSAVNDPTTGLAQRMRNNTVNVLTGGAGFTAGTLTYNSSTGVRTGGYGMMMNKNGVVAYNSSGVNTITIDGTSGAISMRSATILADDGTVLLASGSSLAQQTSTNPNLCPAPTGMTMYNTATGNRNGDVRFGDGQYVWIATTADSSYSGAESQALGIPWGSQYTVSFDAYCTTAGRILNVDVVNSIDYDSTGISVALTTTMTRYSFTETALANANAPLCRLRMFTTAAGGGNIVIANIKVELGNKVTPWCDSVITTANASTYIRSAAIQSAMISDLRTTNYAEDGSGNPTAGAKLASTGTALKVANNSFQVGSVTFSDYWFRLVQAIDGNQANGRVIWRGNNDATTRGGAPDINRLTISFISSQVINSNFQQIYHSFKLVPTSYSTYTDNLDAMQQIHVQLFQSTSSTFPFTEFYWPCPSRTYDGDSGIVQGSWSWGWRFSGSGSLSTISTQLESNGLFTGCMRVRLANSYGWSATKDFAGNASVNANLSTTTITGTSGSSGGGSGGTSAGGGGACPAPWVKVRLASGREVNASDLHDGAVVQAVNDTTLEPIARGGIIRDCCTIWAQRYRVTLADGRATEWSENHRFAVEDRGWVHVQNLRAGDHILGMQESIVTSVLAVGQGQVVSFRVEGAGTYFAGGLLCHNFKMLP
jgi:hypothetical protein